jgi:hypothetical protein
VHQGQCCTVVQLDFHQNMNLIASIRSTHPALTVLFIDTRYDTRDVCKNARERNDEFGGRSFQKTQIYTSNDVVAASASFSSSPSFLPFKQLAAHGSEQYTFATKSPI